MVHPVSYALHSFSLTTSPKSLSLAASNCSWICGSTGRGREGGMDGWRERGMEREGEGGREDMV